MTTIELFMTILYRILRTEQPYKVCQYKFLVKRNKN